MKLRSKLASICGFTLIELLVGASVSSMVLGSVLMGTASMRRTFEVANYHATAQNEQLRIVDYIGQDLRSASTVQVRDSGARVDLTVPVKDSNLVATHLELPILGSLQTASSSTSTRTVSYFREGDRLIRVDNGVQTELAATVADFNVTRTGATAEVTATFSPRFARSSAAASQRDVRLKSFFFLRNATGA